MKYTILSVSILALAFSSCQKAIDLELNNSIPAFVIEGELKEGTQDFKIRITKTSSYFSNEAPTDVKNAVVTLQKAGDIPIELVNDNNGFYSLSNYTAANSSEYSVAVSIDGKTYNASSYMNAPVPLDSVQIEKIQGGPFGGGNEPNYILFCNYKDPAGTFNYYRVKTVLNGQTDKPDNNIVVLDDRLTDGNNIRFPLFSDQFKLNTVVEIQLLSIDKKTYDYFNTLGLIVGGGNGSAAPANPISNWSNGALGYFGATSVSIQTVTIK